MDELQVLTKEYHFGETSYRFGSYLPGHPKRLYIALHGGWPQRAGEENMGYPSFREMSQLEYMTALIPGLVVIMPQAPGSIWKLRPTVNLVDRILAEEQPDEYHLGGFSFGGTVGFYLTRFFSFTSIMICSGIIHPRDRGQSILPARLPPKYAVVSYGENERERNHKQAIGICYELSSLPGGPIILLNPHPGHHQWPIKTSPSDTPPSLLVRAANLTMFEWVDLLPQHPGGALAPY